jgi:oligopeptide transport system substrate-binding protein
MPTNRRTIIAWFLLVTVCAGVGWSLVAGDLPKADFTFINESEVKSVDPALITGQPEGRIAYCLFEGLVRKDPKTLEPRPAVAERWEISDDQRTYTFHLRKNAKWSDGSLVTARDFIYSWQRLLDPRTAGEFAFQAWYIKNAQNYSRGGSGIEPGDAVEVELNLPTSAVNTVRGEILRGMLVRIDERSEDDRDYVVRIDDQGISENTKSPSPPVIPSHDQAGGLITFRPIDDATAARETPPEGVRWCRQVLLDFREVGVKAIDDLTLEITLDNPTHYFLGLLGFYPLFPVNQKCVETYGTPGWTKAENIVTNGPYRMEFRRIRDRIRMVKNEYHWDRDNIRLGVVDALAVESLTTALNLFLTNQADWVGDVPPTAMREMMKAEPPRNDLNPAPFLSSYFYYVQTKRPPLDDLRVRKALSMALDRAEITSKLMPSGDPPSYSLVPPGIPGYQQQLTDRGNPDEARRLLTEAGYPEGRGFPRLEIVTNTQESHQQIAELVRKQWQRELGITTRTRNEEWGAYHSSLRQGKYDLARRGWIADYADPNTFLDLFLTNSEQNSTGWSNAEFDRLIAGAAKEPDAEKRYRMLEAAETILLKELPMIPIYSYVSKNMVKPYVRGFYNNMSDEHFIRDMWIDHESEGPNEFMRGRSETSTE